MYAATSAASQFGAAKASSSRNATISEVAARTPVFRAPESPQQILHPPLGERIREYGYLAGIAVIAVVVGGAALFLANPAHQTPQPMPDHAESGSVLTSDDMTGILLVTDPRD